MSEMLERAARAAWLVGRDWNTPDSFDAAPDYAKDVQRDVARAALLAALDPHDSALQNVILGAMGFYSEGGDFGPMARVQAHDAIAALRQTAQGVPASNE